MAEIQFADYIFPAFDRIVNEAAKFRYQSGNQFNCGGILSSPIRGRQEMVPLVPCLFGLLRKSSGLTIQAPYGAVGHGGHYHSVTRSIFLSRPWHQSGHPKRIFGKEYHAIDLKTLLPWEKESVEASVKKTGRLPLEAPVARICGLDTPFSLVFEPFYMLTKNKMLDAIRSTVNY
ncbi:hypothetical protein MLD38_007379 [Melastoma candidum]|uniref:Uncharacterized protein n=1 Tax=Melastoma candidum TaxID=119954 RepID=A0ACB9RSV4_9MYRT|nr:hypothetical protein MLD38_007379 [Melastoma candidum]